MDEQDKGTPDDWVPRNKELIRLVGRHPMNAEPPTHTLVRKGNFVINMFCRYSLMHSSRTHYSKFHALRQEPWSSA